MSPVARTLAAAPLLALLALLPGLDAAPGPDRGSAQDAAADDPPPLAPAPVAGIRGLRARSRLVRADAPDAAYALEFVHVFPDRSRLTLTPVGGPPTGRRTLLRFGARTWSWDAGAASRVLEGDAARRQLAALELRLALLVWPDGLDWQRTTDGTRAQVEVSCAANVTRPLARLVARLDGDGRPLEASALDEGGAALATLRVRSWREERGRAWPAVLDVVEDGAVVATETLESIETDVRRLDAYFVPVDRRATPEAGQRPVVPPAAPVGLAPVTLRSYDLPEGTDWPAARTRRTELAARAAEELRPLGLALDSTPVLALDADAHPRAVLLRLTEAVAEAPQGWTTLPAREGVVAYLGRLEDLSPALLADVRKKVPEGARPGDAYVRIRTGGAFAAELILPFRR